MEIKRRLLRYTALLVGIPLLGLSLLLFIFSHFFFVELRNETFKSLVVSEYGYVRIKVRSTLEEAFGLVDYGINTGEADRDATKLRRTLEEAKKRGLSAAYFYRRSDAGPEFSDLPAGIGVETRFFAPEVGLSGESGFRVGEPVRIEGFSEPVVPITKAILYERTGGRGLLTLFYPLSSLLDLTGDIRIGKSGYAYLVDRRGLILSHPDRARLGTLSENTALLARLEKEAGKTSFGWPLEDYTYRGERKIMSFESLEPLPWILVFNQTYAEAESPAYKIMAISLFIFFVTFGLGLLISRKTSEIMLQPMASLVGVLDEWRRGNLTARCDEDTKDEMGELAAYMNTMISQLADSRSIILQKQRALEESEARYRLAVDGSSDVIYEFLPLEKKVFVSERYFEITGFPSLPDRDFFDFLASQVVEEDADRLRADLSRHDRGEIAFLYTELRVKGRSEDKRWILIRGKVQKDGRGQVVRIAGSITNISDRKQKEERIKSLAFFDQLTGLPTRHAFNEFAQDFLLSTTAEGGFTAVAILDLDDFRKINDTLGHEFGDALLKTLAERINVFLDESVGLNGSRARVYRFGGDEFVLLLPCFESRQELKEFMQGLLRRLNSSYGLNDRLHFISLSAGISVFPTDSENALELLRKADTALYEAKSKNGKGLCFFKDSMSEDLSRRLVLEELLRTSLKDGGLVLHYQALVSMDSLKLIGFEALVRMKDREGALISPEKFIPVAEKCGLIHETGIWVFREACRQLALWRQQGFFCKYLSVNVSALQFLNKGFALRIRQIVEDFSLHPAHLQIEITESAFMENNAATSAALEYLHGEGFRLALDDFGIGYSSLAYLKSIPLQAIKMDKTFVRDISLDKRHEAIAEGIIGIAHRMGLEIVAEGIESDDQFYYLREKGCTIAQGYLFSKPQEARDLPELLRQGAFQLKAL